MHLLATMFIIFLIVVFWRVFALIALILGAAVLVLVFVIVPLANGPEHQVEYRRMQTAVQADSTIEPVIENGAVAGWKIRDRVEKTRR